MRKLMLVLSLLALLALAIMPAAAQDDAFVRVAHFSPDNAAVDIYVDGEVAVEDFEFTEVSPFLELSADEVHTVSIVATGDSEDDALVGPVEFTFEAGTYTTIAAYGSDLDVTVFTEDFGATTGGQARITLVHVMQGEGGVDLYGSGIQLIQNLRYPEGGDRDGAFSREIPAGRYNFDLTVAENSSSVIREANGVQIQEGENYLIVALGPQSNEGELLIVGIEGNSVEEDDEETEGETEAVEPTATPEDEEEGEEAEVDETEEASSEGETLEGTAWVRIGHFSPDTPAVDIYVDGEVVVEALEFPEVTPFLEVPAGTHSVAVAPTGTSEDDAEIGPADWTFEPDTRTTVAAIGSLENETLTVTAFLEDYENIPAGQARITLLHAIEGESGVDLYGSGIQLIQNLRYPEGGDRDGAFSRDIPAGRYNFDLTVAENASAVIREANGVEISAGDTLLIVAFGPQSNEGELLVVTPDGYENPEEE